MLIIGLTGGIGTGKSLVCSLFQALGIPIIDADVIAREVVQPGRAELQQIRGQFGDGVFVADGSLDRAKLRQMVFNDDRLLAQLEAIIHPGVRREIQSRLNQVRGDYVIICVPLLLEKDYTSIVDRVLVVDTPVDIQRQRVAKRDQISNLEVDAIIDKQMPRQERLNQADDVIDNSGNIDSVRDQVLSLHQKYLELSKHTV